MKISIVTPSLNQGRFIERTILSVIHQKGDFDLEYIIMDGGSTDETLEIINKYKSHLTLETGKDSGQGQALNKGFEMASGDIFGWLNSDDTFEENALIEVVNAYKKYHFEWCFGNCKIINENDQVIRRLVTEYKIFQSKRYSYQRLLSKDFIAQPAVFFTREVYRKTGPLNNDCKYSLDYHYWLRLGESCSPFYIDQYLANFRWHEASKNGRFYEKAAWETFQTAKRHSPKSFTYPVLRHYLHYRMLCVLYRYY